MNKARNSAAGLTAQQRALLDSLLSGGHRTHRIGEPALVDLEHRGLATWIGGYKGRWFPTSLARAVAANNDSEDEMAETTTTCGACGVPFDTTIVTACPTCSIRPRHGEVDQAGVELHRIRVAWGYRDQADTWRPNPLLDMSPREQHLANCATGHNTPEDWPVPAAPV